MWFVNILKKIWEWIKSLFKRKPFVKITVLTFLLISNVSAQRTELQYLFAYFTQPSVEDADMWQIVWYGESNDSLVVYKNDTLRCKIRNDGEWVAFTYMEIDTAEVRVFIDFPFSYDREIHFLITALDTLGNESGADSVSVYFIASDINLIIDPDMDTGYINGDHRVDGLDLIELGRWFGKNGLTYRDFVDITGDGRVDGLDLIQLGRDFGRSYNY